MRGVLAACLLLLVLASVVTAQDGNNTTVSQDDLTGSQDAAGTKPVLGVWDNPLGPPYDGVWGDFALSVVAWLLVAFLVMFLVDPVIKAFTRKTETTLDDAIIRLLRGPLFFLIFVFGVKSSLDIFALPDLAFRILDGAYKVLLVFVAAMVIWRVWHEVVLALGRRMATRTESQLDDRLLPVFEKIGGVIIVVGALVYVLSIFEVNLTMFAAGGVLVSMVIAFAAQDSLGNFFSGVHLLIDQPFKEGDDIILDSGEVVTVSNVGLRSTELYHRANHETIIVPNNILANNRIINLLQPDNRYKVRIDVGVAYGSDIRRVKEILLEVAKSHNLALKSGENEPFVRFQNFGASSLDFSLHVWIDDVYSRWAVGSDLREAIDRRFAEAGIEIPFPQRVIWDGRAEAEAAQDAPPGPTASDTLEDPGASRTVESARREMDDGGDSGE